MRPRIGAGTHARPHMHTTHTHIAHKRVWGLYMKKPPVHRRRGTHTQPPRLYYFFTRGFAMTFRTAL